LGGVIVEPYQGSAGFIFPPEGWLKTLEAWCNEHECLLIVDEVQSGLGRTGKMYAIEWESVKPNMLCLGKGLGSGVPSSALAAESRIFDVMMPGELSSTWGGNPLASAASLAVLDVIAKEHLCENALRVGSRIKEMLHGLQKRHLCIGDVRGMGLVIGLEIVNSSGGNRPDPELTKRILLRSAENGLLLGRVGLYGNVIRIAPPLVITDEEAELAVGILDEALTELPD
jgi:4-aminobutyrate aminotransferase-like enzyme